MVDPSTPIPPWFTEEDLNYYGALYEKSGFQTTLQCPYRYQFCVCLLFQIFSDVRDFPCPCRRFFFLFFVFFSPTESLC